MIAELIRAALGIGRLARFDRLGFAYFGSDGESAWRSFLAVAVVAPMYILWTVMHWADTSGNEVSLGFVLREALSYVGLWLLFPVVMWHVAGAFERQSRFAHFVCAYNWAAAFQNAMYLLLDLVMTATAAPDSARAFFGILLMIYLVAFGWFVAKNALQITTHQAFAVVALDFLLSAVWDALV